jgi:murein tripeptide amidase MpaA
MIKALLLLAVGALGRISYEGQQILRCRYEEASQIHRLEEEIDVQGVLPNNTVDVRVQRESDWDSIKRELTDCQVMVANLEELTKQVEEENEAALRDDPTWFSAYRPYADIQSWLQKYANDNPGLVKYTTLGTKTSGGRDISGVIVYGGGATTPRYRAWNTGGIHAREWVAPTTVMYIFDQLVSRYKDRSDANITTYVNAVETYFFPSVNPDGYEFSRTNDRQWRKNRRTNAGASCIGVDCNRNFPDHWGQGGSSNSTCSDTYMGPSARSEAETIAITTLFSKLASESPRIIHAIDWHSYSQLFLRPYGWTNNVSPDEARFVTIGNKYVDDVKAYQGKVYVSQRSYQLYQTTGSASDWYYGASNTKNNTQRTAGWTVELRPSSSEQNVGFVLPPAQISPTGQENWIAYKNLQWSIYNSPLP